MDKIDLALKLLSIGWNILPMGKNKQPIVPWKKYQNQRVTEDEIKNWFTRFPDANLGVVTGVISNIVVLDIDAQHSRTPDEFQIPPTITSRTGGGGWHFIFQHPGFLTSNSAGQLFGPGIDIRGDGGCIVIPPSLHLSGNYYEWVENCSPFEISPAPLPEWLSRGLFPQKEKLWRKNPSEIIEGTRNQSAASLAGKLQKCLPHELWESIGWAGFTVWNSKIPTPISEKELRSVWDSVQKYQSTKNKAADDRPLRIWDIDQILKENFGDQEWLIESMIPKQGIMALSGNPGDCKTWLTIHFALCYSRGIPAFGKFCSSQGTTLIIDEEDHIRLIKKRLQLLGAKSEDKIHYLSQAGIKVDDEALLESILKIIREKEVTLVILDSLVRIHQQEENDASGMSKVFSSLQKMTAEGASILFTHHHRKQIGFGANNLGQSMRGSSDILAAVDCHITVEKNRDNEDHLLIKQSKLRQAELIPHFEVEIMKNEGNISDFQYSGEYDEKKNRIEEAALAITEILSEGMKSRPNIIEILKKEFGKTLIDFALKSAVETNKIQRVPKDELPPGEKKSFYRISSSEKVLPVSVSNIGEETQEDALDNYQGSLSICCNSPMLGDGQCLGCGANGLTGGF